MASFHAWDELPAGVLIRNCAHLLGIADIVCANATIDLKPYGNPRILIQAEPIAPVPELVSDIPSTRTKIKQTDVA